MCSEILIVVGMFFEILSFFNGARGVLFFRKSMKEKKQKYIDEMGKSIEKEIADKEKKWLISSGLLVFGLFLQAIAQFL